MIPLSFWRILKNILLLTSKQPQAVFIDSINYFIMVQASICILCHLCAIIFKGGGSMRKISAKDITSQVEKLCIDANHNLNEDIKDALKKALGEEKSSLGKEILEQILENARIAHEEKMPMCQDTGMAVVFLEIGQDVSIVDGDLYEAINQGVRQGYQKGYLRKSVVDDPFIHRINTGDNTPAIMHTTIVPGERLKIVIAPKGFGSENMSTLKMLKPADGVKGIKDFVIDTVKKAGPNPCPPIVVGVGIGGTMEKAAYLAKKSLIRSLGQHHENDEVAGLEKELLEEINRLNIGPQGLGGNTTALGVHIETFPTHIAGMPVAVNINCHATRHAEAIL